MFIESILFAALFAFFVLCRLILHHLPPTPTGSASANEYYGVGWPNILPPYVTWNKIWSL